MKNDNNCLVHQGIATQVANFRGRQGFLFLEVSPFKMFFIEIIGTQVIWTTMIQELPLINLAGRMSFISLADEIHLIIMNTDVSSYGMDWQTETLKRSELENQVQLSSSSAIFKTSTKWWPNVKGIKIASFVHFFSSIIVIIEHFFDSALCLWKTLLVMSRCFCTWSHST